MSSSNSDTSVRGGISQPKLLVFICLVLAIGTIGIYWPITHYPFIEFDDTQYVVGNPHVTSGLTATNAIWAFTTTEQANWHPITWLSHQLDCTLFGVNPGAIHFVNLLYHVANSLLLFFFLRSATGALWRSGFVAALFAWHPMHVESVAWAAERKDVLSTFFWFLALLTYLGYARAATGKPEPAGPPAGSKPRRRAVLFYLATLLCAALGLMSKPMVVTLPFALILLDFWPLNRLAGFTFESSLRSAARCQPVSIRRIVLEKIPLLALSLGGSLSTYAAQSSGGAISHIGVGERLANAALAYARYTAKLFWPTDLAIVYPHPRHWSIVLALLAAAVLLVWTFLCVQGWRKYPFLASGWFWYLGTLVPTIGLIQVGAQSMADRYTYVPSVGLFIVVAWGVTEYLSSRGTGRAILGLLAGAALVGCLGATSLQISLWRNSVTLFRHAIEVTTDNYVAENALGKTYEKMGDNARALYLYQWSVQTEPRFPTSQFNLAMCLLTVGQTAEGLQHLKAAAALEPRDPDIQYDLGIYFSQHASWTNAVNCFSNSVTVRPDFAPAQFAFGGALANLGQAREAAAHLRQALSLDPNLLAAKTNLDRLMAEHPEIR
jgi:tetratricopeptide (TPR) repeat protein